MTSHMEDVVADYQAEYKFFPRTQRTTSHMEDVAAHFQALYKVFPRSQTDNFTHRWCCSRLAGSVQCLFKIKDRQLQQHMEDGVANYQASFRRHRSTSDLIIFYETNITEMLLERQRCPRDICRLHKGFQQCEQKPNIQGSSQDRHLQATGEPDKGNPYWKVTIQGHIKIPSTAWGETRRCPSYDHF